MAKAIISKKFKEGLIDKVIFNSVSIKKKKKNIEWNRDRFSKYILGKKQIQNYC